MTEDVAAGHGDFMDLALPDARADLAKWIILAKRRYKKSYLAQMFEIWRLGRAAGKLLPLEYYVYKLYDDRRFDRRAKRAFVGNRAKDALYERCNDASERSLIDDKLASAAWLAHYGVRTPKILAVYHPTRSFGTAAAASSPADLAALLRSGIDYPFFSKPNLGTSSLGVASVRACDAATDSLILADGRAVPIPAFVDKISRFRETGYLFQEHLRPHPDLAALCGERVSTVRIVLLCTADGPELLHAIWKVPVGDNVADNLWRSGNLLAAVEPDSGTVQRVVRGLGPEEEEVTAHPDTGRRLTGAVLPDWPALRRLCFEASAIYPGLRLQSWDVALCPDGPLINEINARGALDLPQRAAGAGFITERLRRFLEAGT